MRISIQKPLWLLFLAATLISCSGSGNQTSEEEVESQYLEMSIDGKAWEADESFRLEFVESAAIEKEGYYPLLLSAIQPKGGIVFQINVLLPLDKLSDPVGTYPIVYGNKVGIATMTYRDLNSPFIFISDRPNGSSNNGTLIITEFEKGDGAFAQRQIYKLKGMFSGTLWALEKGNKTGEAMQITNGKFELLNALHQLNK